MKPLHLEPHQSDDVKTGAGRLQPKEVQKSTASTLTSGRAYLPLVTKKPKKKMPGEDEADQYFYRNFKLVYVDIPVPEDELPCE